MQKIRVNMVSESEISVQGHGVHTAYKELATALSDRHDVELIRGQFGHSVDCDILHFHTIGSHTWRKLFQRGPKKVISAHVIPQSFIGSIILAKYWLFAARWYMQWYYNRADRVLAVSKTVARILHDELHVPKKKIETLYNTIDMKQYAFTAQDKQTARQELGLSPSDFVVVGNGQVQPRKRLDVFETMARALPDTIFIWVGGIPFKQLGDDYVSMQKLIERAPKNFIVTGVVPHQKVKTYLAAADIFCLPAEQENHPMCVLEAAGSGLPILLRDIPEYDDTFGNDAWRLRDDQFVQAVTTLRTDKAVYRQWRQKARAIARRFDSSQGADRLVNIYKKLV